MRSIKAQRNKKPSPLLFAGFWSLPGKDWLDIQEMSWSREPLPSSTGKPLISSTNFHGKKHRPASSTYQEMVPRAPCGERRGILRKGFHLVFGLEEQTQPCSCEVTTWATAACLDIECLTWGDGCAVGVGWHQGRVQGSRGQVGCRLGTWGLLAGPAPPCCPARPSQHCALSCMSTGHLPEADCN